MWALHYRTRVLCRVCRVSQTLGKGRKTLGNFFAECSTRRSTHGLSSTDEAGFAECFFSGTRQTFVTGVCGLVWCTWHLLPSDAHAALGKVWLCRVPRGWHSAKVSFAKGCLFAEYFFVGTRQVVILPSARYCALGIRRVSGSVSSFHMQVG